MNKLTDHQIEFIDKYLENSGVKYPDIRFEMTDHVATALEVMKGDFNENFRQYMLLHKKELLESNKKFAALARKRALAMLLKTIVSPFFIFVWALLFGISYLFIKTFGYRADEGVLTNIFGTILIILGAYSITVRLLDNAKNGSVADNLLNISAVNVYLLITVFKIERLIDNQIFLLAYYTFLVSFACLSYLSFKKLKSKYKMQDNG